jgi:hypothetical protein
MWYLEEGRSTQYHDTPYLMVKRFKRATKLGVCSTVLIILHIRLRLITISEASMEHALRVTYIYIAMCQVIAV